jgi:MFS family permease
VNDDSIHTSNATQYRIAAAIFFFISGFGYATWASRIPTIKYQLQLTDAQLGTVLFALPVGLMLTMPVTSRLLGRYPSRAVMLFGCLLLSIVLVLIGFAGNRWQLAFCLFFFGVSRNLITLSVNTQGVAVQALYKKSIMAAFHGIWSMAGFAGAAAGLVMVYFNIIPKWHFIAVSIVLDITALWFIRQTLEQKPVLRSPGPVFVMPDMHLLKFSLICFCSMACENTMYDWGALFFQKHVNPEKTTDTAAFVIYLVAMTGARFFGDRIVTRIGIKPVLKFSGLFIFCGMLLSVILPYTVTAALGFILVGLGVACIVPMVFSLAGKSKNMSSSSALASISTIGYMGFVLVPPFVGYIAQAFSLRVSFGLISLLGGVIVYLVSTIRQDSGQDETFQTSAATQID